MMHEYQVELTALKPVCGEAYVEVEEIIKDDGSIDWDSMEDEAARKARHEANHHRVDWINEGTDEIRAIQVVNVVLDR